MYTECTAYKKDVLGVMDKYIGFWLYYVPEHSAMYHTNIEQ